MPETWMHNVDLMAVSIRGLCAVVVWLGIRTLTKIDKNQSNLFEVFEDHERRLSKLEGEHSARMIRWHGGDRV